MFNKYNDLNLVLSYPSGRVAIVTSSCGVGRPGYYTIAYDDTPEQRMLAAFTPSGRGCCYHENGNRCFIEYLKLFSSNF